MSTKLDALRIEEISAVGTGDLGPANLLEGWMIQKAKGAADLSKTLDLWLEQAITKADPPTISALATVAKANPVRPIPPSGAPAPAADLRREDSAAEKHNGFFRPARNAYQRIF